MKTTTCHLEEEEVIFEGGMDDIQTVMEDLKDLFCKQAEDETSSF